MRRGGEVESRRLADGRVVRCCEEAIESLGAQLPEAQLTCMLRTADTLRLVAHRGPLRVIYEIPHDFGGVVWRAVDSGEIVLVADVRADPDYIAVDDSVVSELAAPVRVGDAVVGLLNAETWVRPFGEAEAKAAGRAAGALAGELAQLRV